ncbi:MAG: hypothetical protein KF788_21900 [Piscinibacter sp.]|nr:hypothetical protein [Piscinibacter sp.]
MNPAELAAGLADFEPLRRAERVLLKALARDDIARVGLRRPAERSDDVAVRGALLARLAAGGGTLPRLRRLQLLGAWIEGPLDLGDLRVGASLWFYRCVFEVAPRLDGARLGGSLSLGDCLLPGLLAERARIAQDLMVHAGCNVASELRLEGARIGADLVLSRSVLHDEHDASLRRPLLADRVRVGGNVRLDDGFQAHGEVRFVGARIGGDVIVSRAQLNGPVDPAGVRRDALVMDRAEIGGHLRLDQGFSAAGRVCLRRTRIGGDLDCSGAGFDRVGDASWGDGASLVLERARVHGALVLCGLQGPLLGASFAGTRVGTLVDDVSSWGERLVLDGFAYSRFGEGAPLDAPFRLAWLERQPGSHLAEDFRHHPWRCLIAVLARMGETHSAGEVALRREGRLRRSGRVGRSFPRALRWVARLGHGLYGWTLGYGWRPQRLAAWLLAVWLGSALVYGAAADQGALSAPSPQARFSPLAHSADRLLPLVDLEPAPEWTPPPRARAEAADWALGARWVGRLEALLGWMALLGLAASLAGRARRETGR